MKYCHGVYAFLCAPQNREAKQSTLTQPGYVYKPVGFSMLYINLWPVFIAALARSRHSQMSHNSGFSDLGVPADSP